VARGEYYAAGAAKYDRFFILLYEKQVELLSAPGEPRAARESLTNALALTPDASNDALAQRLRLETQKLASQGLYVRLEVPPPSASLDASATLHTSETSTPSPLRTALPQGATRLVRARNRMLATRAELEKLQVMGITLEGDIDRAFRTEGPWKRDEVRNNLSDGQKVLTLMQSRAREVELVASRLLDLLGAVSTTDPSLGQPLAEPAPPVETTKPRRTGARSVAAQRSGPTKPAPAPSSPENTSPQRGTEDDAASPRPTQGSAPAEIEP
jgi:hypothetical protein